MTPLELAYEKWNSGEPLTVEEEQLLIADGITDEELYPEEEPEPEVTVYQEQVLNALSRIIELLEV